MDQHNIKYKITYKRAKTIPNTEDTSICPDCGAETITDYGHGEIYCRDCGLVVKASIAYVGNEYCVYPYGILL